MEKIQSFKIDHTKLKPGIYIARQDQDITTYDIRFIKPNTPPFLEIPAIHSLEHILATFLRNCEYGENIIYFGPMGCRTGFYLLVRNLEDEKVLKIIKEAFYFCTNFNQPLPGNIAKECGNFLEHDLLKAKIYAKNMYKIIKNWQTKQLDYNFEL